MKVLITSGGCKAPIDEVRYIGNFSSGRFGAELASQFYSIDGIHTYFFHEKGSRVPFNDQYISIPRNSSFFKKEYKDYNDYLNVKHVITTLKPDIIISAAAISDYIPVPIEGKMSSDQDTIALVLKKSEKVIKSFRELTPDAYIVGFKLLVSPTEEQITAAVDKVFDSGADMVIYNDLTELRKGDATRRIYFNKPSDNDAISKYMNTSRLEVIVDSILAQAPMKRIFR